MKENKTRDVIYCQQGPEKILIKVFNFCW